MWEQKKANTPQVYSPLYGLNSGQSSGQQIPQQSVPSQQQQLQHLQQLQYQQMSAQMGQPLGSGLSSGLGPPPPYTPYTESAQQQMKWQQLYQQQYMPNTTLPSVVPQQHQSTASLAQHSYPNPYPTNPYQNPGLYQYSPYANLATNATVVMPQGFDSGARFDSVSRQVIPPPPPGVVPNAAQMAVMQGQNVVIGQKKGSFLEGGSSGGYTFW